MAKYGTIIEKLHPVVLGFYNSHCIGQELFHETLRTIHRDFGSAISVGKIDEVVNSEIFEALNITTLPTYLIYNNGTEVFRSKGDTPTLLLNNELRDQLLKTAV